MAHAQTSSNFFLATDRAVPPAWSQANHGHKELAATGSTSVESGNGLLISTSTICLLEPGFLIGALWGQRPCGPTGSSRGPKSLCCLFFTWAQSKHISCKMRSRAHHVSSWHLSSCKVCGTGGHTSHHPIAHVWHRGWLGDNRDLARLGRSAAQGWGKPWWLFEHAGIQTCTSESWRASSLGETMWVFLVYPLLSWRKGDVAILARERPPPCQNALPGGRLPTEDCGHKMLVPLTIGAYSAFAASRLQVC